MTRKANGSPKPKRKSARRRYGPGRPTSLDLEQRKARILAIARALFFEKGFAETSLVDVAKQAGVATRTIYQHYGDKEAIFRVVIGNPVLESVAELPAPEGDRSLFDVLLSTAHYVCAVTLSDAAIPFQRLMIAESHRFPDLMHSVFDSLHQRFHLNVAQIFERLDAEGKIPAGDHTESAKYFIDLLLGNAPMQLNMNWIHTGPSEEEIRDKVTLFMAGRFGINPDAGTTKSASKKVSRSPVQPEPTI